MSVVLSVLRKEQKGRVHMLHELEVVVVVGEEGGAEEAPGETEGVAEEVTEEEATEEEEARNRE